MTNKYFYFCTLSRLASRPSAGTKLTPFCLVSCPVCVAFFSHLVCKAGCGSPFCRLLAPKS